MLINDNVLLLDLFGDSEGTKLLIWTVNFCLVFTAPAKWRVELRAKIGQYSNRCFASFELWLLPRSYSRRTVNGTATLLNSSFCWNRPKCPSAFSQEKTVCPIQELNVLEDWEKHFSYLRQENSTGRGVPTFSVWYRACLSGTARGCLVQAARRFLLFIYVSNYDVTTQSATFPATSEGFRGVKKNIIGMFLFKMHISTRYEKNNQVPVLDPDRQISVSADTMSHPSLGYRLDWYLWHRITLDWDLSVCIEHWYLILLVQPTRLYFILPWNRLKQLIFGGLYNLCSISSLS